MAVGRVVETLQGQGGRGKFRLRLRSFLRRWIFNTTASITTSSPQLPAHPLRHGPLRLPPAARPPDGQGPLRHAPQQPTPPVVQHRRRHPPQRSPRPPPPAHPPHPRHQAAQQALPAAAHCLPRGQAAQRLLWRPPLGAGPPAHGGRGQRKRREKLRLEQDCAAGQGPGRGKRRPAPALAHAEQEAPQGRRLRCRPQRILPLPTPRGAAAARRQGRGPARGRLLWPRPARGRHAARGPRLGRLEGVGRQADRGRAADARANVLGLAARRARAERGRVQQCPGGGAGLCAAEPGGTKGVGRCGASSLRTRMGHRGERDDCILDVYFQCRLDRGDSAVFGGMIPKAKMHGPDGRFLFLAHQGECVVGFIIAVKW